MTDLKAHTRPGVERFSCDFCQKSKAKCRPVFLDNSYELDMEVASCERCMRLSRETCTVGGEPYAQYQLRLMKKKDGKSHMEAPPLIPNVPVLEAVEQRLQPPSKKPKVGPSPPALPPSGQPSRKPQPVQQQALQKQAQQQAKSPHPHAASPGMFMEYSSYPQSYPNMYPSLQVQGMSPMSQMQAMQAIQPMQAMQPMPMPPQMQLGMDQSYYNYQGYFQPASPYITPYPPTPQHGTTPQGTSPKNIALSPPSPTLTQERLWFAQNTQNLQRVNLALSQLGLEAETLDWIVSKFFFDSLAYIQALIPEPLLQNRAWLAFPLLTAAAVLSSFHRKNGKLLGNEEKNIKVEVSKLHNLFEKTATCIFSIIDMSFLQSPLGEPIVPLTLFLGAVLCMEVIHASYSFVRTERLCRSVQLGLGVIARWQLHQMDLWRPQFTRETPPNAYLIQLWDDGKENFPGNPFLWRTLTRKIIWQLAITDSIYSSIFDEYPRITVLDLAYLACCPPDDVFIKAQQVNSWDNFYNYPSGHVMNNLSWMFLAKGNPQREAGLSFACSNIKETKVMVLNHMTMLMGLATLGTIFESPPVMKGTFQPFVNLGVKVEQCAHLQGDPVGFWLEFIDDVLIHLQEPLKSQLLEGKIQDLWDTCESWWDQNTACRFFVYLIRLYDYRLRLSAWTPQLSLTGLGRGLVQQVKTNLIQQMGEDAAPFILHQPSAWLQMGTGGTEWFRIFSHANFEGVLEDAICLSELMRTMTSAFAGSDKVRLGHSVLSVATRISLIYLSLMNTLQTQGNAPALLESAIEDAKVHVAFLKEANRFTVTQGQSLWLTRLEDMMTKMQSPTTETAGLFYQSFLEGSSQE